MMLGYPCHFVGDLVFPLSFFHVFMSVGCIQISEFNLMCLVSFSFFKIRLCPPIDFRS
uniref:Uncharacterized protein n=1 Tax=Arundo donax TaxID=35708 RepID=A0A0A9DRV7_ARUDO